MADVKTALRAALGADAGIIAILGSPAINRIFAPVLPVGASLATKPALAIQRIVRDHLAAQIGGPQVAPMHRLQVTSFALKVSDSEALSAAVITALDGFTGTADTVQLRVIRYVGGTGFDDYDPETGINRVPMDFEVQL